jgi:hypothetical protein
MTPVWIAIFLLPIIVTVMVERYFLSRRGYSLSDMDGSIFEEVDFKYKHIFIALSLITVFIFTAYQVLASLAMGYDGSSYWILMIDNSLRMIQSVAILNADSYPPQMMADLPISSHSTHYHFGTPAIGSLFAELLDADPAVTYLKYSTPLIIFTSIFILFLLVGYYKSWYAASVVAAVCLMPNLEMLLQVAYKLPGSFVISLFNEESTFSIWVERALGYNWHWTYDAVLLDSAKAAIVQGVGIFLAFYMLFGRVRAKMYFLALSPFLLMMNSRFILPIVLIAMWQIIIYLFDRLGRKTIYIVLGVYLCFLVFAVYLLNNTVFDFLVVEKIPFKDFHPVGLTSIVLISVLQFWFSRKLSDSKTRIILISYALPSVLLLIFFNTFQFKFVSSQLLTVFSFGNLVLDNFSNFTLQMSVFLFVYYFSSAVVSWFKYYLAVIGFFMLFAVGKTFGMAQNFYYLNTDIASVHQSVDFINYYNCLDAVDTESIILQNSQTYPPGNTGFEPPLKGFAAFYHMLGHKESNNAEKGINLLADPASSKADVMDFLSNNQVDYVIIDKRFNDPAYFTDAVIYENSECKMVSVKELLAE